MEQANLEQALLAIQERNLRVEADKAWELSYTRRFFIAFTMYVVAAIWLFLIKDTRPMLKAAVPAIGYVLSTFSLPIIKKWWLTKQLPRR